MPAFRITLLLLAFLFQLNTIAQTKSSSNKAPSDSSHNKKYNYVETMPVFPGGEKRMWAIISDSLRYPPLALRDQVQGKVYMSFILDSTGSMTNLLIKKGIRPDLDGEAMRCLQRLTPYRWEPGTQNGCPVSVSFTVPLTFRINNNPENNFPPDSLDLNHGPTILLPTGGWSVRQKAIPADKGVIYGNCVQRLGINSGGLAQYVRLINLDSHKAFRILVKPAMRSRKENAFCVALPPGRYALYEYEYSYGFEVLRKSHVGSLVDTRYIFTVQPGQLQYVGTWDLSQSQRPHFTADKAVLDSQISADYSSLYFANALVAFPK